MADGNSPTARRAWQTTPALDPRTYLSPATRGVRARIATLPSPTVALPVDRPLFVEPPPPVVDFTRAKPPAPRPERLPMFRRIPRNATTRELVLIAVAQCDPDAGAVGLADIVVKAWRASPESFGLPGYTYPHSLRVQPKVSDLCASGWIVATAPNEWRVTTAGRVKLRELSKRANAVMRERAAT